MENIKTPENIGEYFGTLQESVTNSWRYHLKSNRHSEHVILEEYYEDSLEAVDAIIESWMGSHEKVKEYESIFTPDEDMSPVEYIEALKQFVEDGRDELIDEDETEVLSLIDDLLNIMNSALYKLKNLVESKGLSDYLHSILD